MSYCNVPFPAPATQSHAPTLPGTSIDCACHQMSHWCCAGHTTSQQRTCNVPFPAPATQSHAPTLPGCFNRLRLPPKLRPPHNVTIQRTIPCTSHTDPRCNWKCHVYKRANFTCTSEPISRVQANPRPTFSTILCLCQLIGDSWKEPLEMRHHQAASPSPAFRLPSWWPSPILVLLPMLWWQCCKPSSSSADFDGYRISQQHFNNITTWSWEKTCPKTVTLHPTSKPSKPKVRPAIHRSLRIQESQSLSMDTPILGIWYRCVGVISESGGEAVKQQSTITNHVWKSSMNYSLKRTPFPTRTRRIYRIYLCVVLFQFLQIL